MKTKRSLLAILIMLFAMMFVLVACRRADEDPPDNDYPANGYEDTLPGPADRTTTRTHLTIVTASLPVQLDHSSNDSPSAQVSRHIFDTLFDLCYDTFEVLPHLAINWSQPDASTTHIEIRQGVYFHDGTPLTAHEVAFSLERVAAIGGAAAITGMISHVTVQDDWNLTVHTEVPFAPILRHLAHPITGIISYEHYWSFGDDAEARQTGIREHPVGSGMYEFVDWVLGERVDLRRNDNWWGELPLIETLTWRHMPDANLRYLAVSTGEADVGLGIAPADVAVANADPNVTLLRRQTLATDYMGINTSAPYLDDYRVRQAINYALDLEGIVAAAWHGVGSLARGPISDIVWGFADTPPFRHDVDRARELLAEAGLADGFSTEIWFNIGNPAREDVAQMAAAQLRELGIDVYVRGVEWATYLELTEEGVESRMFILGWSSVTGDADYGLHPLFHSTMHGPNNRSFFSHDRIDELLDAGRSEVDPVARLEIYREAQQYIRDQAPWVFLRQGEEVTVVSPMMRNITLNPAGHHNYGVVWFD
jgi:peptide/nickel transport system substrate-binding protein